MRKYNSLATHNAPCNEIFYKLQDCQYEHPYRKYMGFCRDYEKQLQVCIAKRLQSNREINNKAAKERLQRMHSKKEESKKSE